MVYIVMSRPLKPFPASMFANYKLKIRHFLVFDFFCNEAQPDDTGWVFIDNKKIVRWMKERWDLKIDSPKPYLSTLAEYGYIEFIHNDGYKSALQRASGVIDYEVKVLEGSWEAKEPPKRPDYYNDPDYKKQYNLRRAAKKRAKTVHSI